jgi:hypothetical protein
VFNTELAAWLRTIDGADTIRNGLLYARKANVCVVRPGEFGIPRFTLSPLFIRAILDFLPVITSGVVELRVTAVALSLRITTSLRNSYQLRPRGMHCMLTVPECMQLESQWPRQPQAGGLLGRIGLLPASSHRDPVRRFSNPQQKSAAAAAAGRVLLQTTNLWFGVPC